MSLGNLTKQEIAQRALHLNCGELREEVIARVNDLGNSHEIITTNSTGFCGIKKSYGIVPKKGQKVTFFLEKNRCGVVGVDLDNKPVYYKTYQALEREKLKEVAKQEKEKAKKKIASDKALANPKSFFNKTLSSFPEIFQTRFKNFFEKGIDFWDLAGYELTACSAAIKIAEYAKTREGVEKFKKLNAKKSTAILGEDLSSNLSYNQIEFAYIMAVIYLENKERILTFPGAMTPLCGSKPYFGK
jgi:hypothetical protein